MSVENPIILGYDSGVEEGERRATARIVKLLREAADVPSLTPAEAGAFDAAADQIEREAP